MEWFQPTNLSQIDEWKPLQFNDPLGIALLAILGCIFLLMIVRRSDLYWHELLILILGSALAISHQRLALVFGILTAPVLSRLLSTSWDRYNPEEDHPWVNATQITIAMLIVILAFPTRQNLLTQVNQGNPVKAVEFIKTHHLSGNMLNSYRSGGYLIWALPDQPVFLDGRADLYEWAGVLDEFANWATLQNDPNRLLDKYGVDFCLLQRDSLMAHVMFLLPGWKMIYYDDDSVIFVRSALERQLSGSQSPVIH